MSRETSLIEERLQAAGYKTSRECDIVIVQIPVTAKDPVTGESFVSHCDFREILTIPEVSFFLQEQQNRWRHDYK